MSGKASRGSPLATVAPRNVISSAARDIRINTANLTEVQSAFLASRFRLDAPRARLTAELCWGRS